MADDHANIAVLPMTGLPVGFPVFVRPPQWYFADRLTTIPADC